MDRSRARMPIQTSNGSGRSDTDRRARGNNPSMRCKFSCWAGSLLDSLRIIRCAHQLLLDSSSSRVVLIGQRSSLPISHDKHQCAGQAPQIFMTSNLNSGPIGNTAARGPESRSRQQHGLALVWLVAGKSCRFRSAFFSWGANTSSWSRHRSLVVTTLPRAFLHT
jgi:hypothetical protein